jgi:hypothetical protein
MPTAVREHGMRMGRMGVLRLSGTTSVGIGAGAEGWEVGAVDGGEENVVENVDEAGDFVGVV